MKKIFAKDKNYRKQVARNELHIFTLKQISSNLANSKLIHWNSLKTLLKIPKQRSKTHVSNRCIQTINRKSFHKFSSFSRIVFIRLAKLGQISGLRKSSW